MSQYNTEWYADEMPWYAGFPKTQSRTLPVLSLDSGMTFERSTTLFGNDSIQTLEPRVYYLYVPYRDQSELPVRSEEHTSELQSLMRISYAVFCLKKTKTQSIHNNTQTTTKQTYQQEQNT